MKQNSSFRFASQIRSYALPILVITFGLQFIRSFIPGLAWYLRDTVAVGTLSLIPYAFGTFALGFLAPLIRRLAGTKVALWITAGGLAIVRVVGQINGSPEIDLWLNIAGIGLFLNFLVIFIGCTRESSTNSSERWTYSLVLGFALDTGLRGIFGPRDLSTVAGFLPLAIIVILAGLIFLALVREPKPTPGFKCDSNGKHSIGLLVIGSYMVLQLLYFQSSGWLEEVASLGFPSGFIIIMLGYLVAARGLGLGYANPRLMHPLLAIGFGILLVITVFNANHLAGFAILTLLIGQFFLGWGLAGIGLSNELGIKRGLWRTTLAVTGGMILFLTLSFAFYLALDIALPIPRDSFPAIAAGILGVLITAGAFQNRAKSTTTWDHTGTIAAGILILIPLVCWILWSTPPVPSQPEGLPVKVMTYNIHSGYNVDGGQDFEAIARVIEDSGADVIGLQEVSRGRLMDGAVDMTTWLSRRLEMQVLFLGTGEPTWGNALLSKYPIIESGEGNLPDEGSLLKRGYLWAAIDVGEDEPLYVIVTHLHHIVADSQVRQVQVPVILDFWDGRGQTILLGDLNAGPDSVEMGLISKAGLVDSWAESGVGDGYTYYATRPDKRIDFLWHSPDLKALEIEVIQTPASDHLPVIGEMNLK
jgi:endonuclease/exonuclease/phosphatase family metal-dependent hydrolase